MFLFVLSAATISDHFRATNRPANASLFLKLSHNAQHSSRPSLSCKYSRNSSARLNCPPLPPCLKDSMCCHGYPAAPVRIAIYTKTGTGRNSVSCPNKIMHLLFLFYPSLMFSVCQVAVRLETSRCFASPGFDWVFRLNFQTTNQGSFVKLYVQITMRNQVIATEATFKLYTSSHLLHIIFSLIESAHAYSHLCNF